MNILVTGPFQKKKRYPWSRVTLKKRFTAAQLQLKTNKQLGASSQQQEANLVIISECMVRTERAFLEATHTGNFSQLHPGSCFRMQSSSLYQVRN